MSYKIEIRSSPQKFAVEYRGDNKESPVLVGYAARFNCESEVLGRAPTPWREMLMPGCFTRCLNENPDIRALYSHDTSQVIGRTRAGTLKLSQDDLGLRCEIMLPNTQVARDLVENINLGNIDGMSFAFVPHYESIRWSQKQGYNLRTIHEVARFEEVSVVAFPAYTEATVEARDLPDFMRLETEGAPISQLLRRRVDIQKTINYHVYQT